MDSTSPPIKPVKKSLFSLGAAQASTGGLAALFSSFRKAVDRMPHAPEDHLRYLHLKLHTADLARSRACWVGGRLYNRASGETSDYVPMSPRHLAQTLRILELKLPASLPDAETYLLRTDLAESAYDCLADHLNVARRS